MQLHFAGLEKNREFFAIVDTNLRGAMLTGAYVRGADLRGASLYDVDLRGATLAGADLRSLSRIRRAWRRRRPALPRVPPSWVPADPRCPRQAQLVGKPRRLSKAVTSGSRPRKAR